MSKKNSKFELKENMMAETNNTWKLGGITSGGIRKERIFESLKEGEKDFLVPFVVDVSGSMDTRWTIE